MATIGARFEDGLVAEAFRQSTSREAGAGAADQHPVPDNDELRECARIESSQWWPVDRRQHSDFVASARRTIGALLEQVSSGGPLLSLLASEDREWVLDNARLLRALWLGADESRRSISEQPHVQSQAGGRLLARPLVVAGGFLGATGFCFDAEALAAYLAGWQQEQRLEMGELWALKSSLELSVLQELAGAVQPLLNLPATGLHLVPAPSRTPISVLITALRKIGDEDWQVLFEQISVVDEVLRQDPVRAYAEMDYASRDHYRSVIAELASHSALDEVEVAQVAVAMAKSAQNTQHPSPRIAERESHIGYYLLDDGLSDLRSRIGYRAPWGRRLRDLILKFPSAFYLTGIETFAFLIVALAMDGLPRFASVVASFFFFFIPASQAAVEIMNSLVTSLLPTRQLPKLDFSEGIPDQYKTMVAVPSLLLNERQVKDLVEGLEVRYLANREPNLYFALLTDNPDARQPFDRSDKQEGLAKYCSRLINELNQKYAASHEKPFFLFHRHPEFNPSENVWMGWERKRGKLLDLNKLLRGAGDKFPVKVGDLSVLPQIRFVITLDCDTQLPKDTAHRLIGTLAHPLNRAIVDPVTNTVVSGYGILQPRVGISVNSASRSRLA
ncbi:MAG TPA: hypothetical protein VFO27_00905, partial [Bryobacteraceae bacterium]|nr:hypothetical protein [Bryobacteraceae bacterium]